MEIGAVETVAAQYPAGLPQDEDFGMGGGVGVLARAIAGCCDDLPPEHDDGAHRRLAPPGGGLGLGECDLHECCHLVHGQPSCTWRGEPPQ